MQIVNKKFIDALPKAVKTGRGMSPLALNAYEIKVGENLWLTKKEYKEMGYKSSKPAYLISSACFQPRSRFFGRRYSITLRGDGWVITRKK